MSEQQSSVSRQGKADDITTVLAAGARPGRKLWRAGAVLALGLAIAGWMFWPSQGAQVTYQTEPATRETLVVIVTATGTVQPTTEVEVSSELSGTVASVEVSYNDLVEPGQVLARLDSRKIEAQVANAEAARARAKAGVVQAEATARQAAQDLVRAKGLAGRGIAAQTSLETAEAGDERARAALDSAHADLTVAEANLALEQADLDKATIRSPIQGMVLDRAIETGQIVASSLNAPVLFTLAEDLSRMELQVDIDEADIGQVAVGNQAEFTVEAWRGRAFPAEIIQLRYAPEETDGVVTYKAVLSVDNTEGLLRPGMTATASITVKKITDALTVPNSALRFVPPQTAASSSARRSSGSGLMGMLMPRPGSGRTVAAAPTGKSVWVLRSGAPVEVPVTPGASDGRRTEIAEENGELGLQEDDQVITDQRSGNS